MTGAPWVGVPAVAGSAGSNSTAVSLKHPPRPILTGAPRWSIHLTLIDLRMHEPVVECRSHPVCQGIVDHHLHQVRPRATSSRRICRLERNRMTYDRRAPMWLC
jgi:hypothetical protein